MRLLKPERVQMCEAEVSVEQVQEEKPASFDFFKDSHFPQRYSHYICRITNVPQQTQTA